MKMIMHKIYICLFCLLFVAMVIVFNTFPRSTFSELEKRELSTFPEFSADKLSGGVFTSEISKWYSDSEPFRDELMWLSMTLKDYTALRLGNDDDAVVFHAAEPENTQAEEVRKTEEELELEGRDVADYENRINADENAKIAHAGIIIVGSGEKVRALMAFGGGPNSGLHYAEVANLYQETFGDKVNVYCMVIPLSTEFYCPEKAKKSTKPELPVIKNVFAKLSPKVKAVDVYTPLSQHVEEDIYLRTDHHWAPLGAYYAAQKFAEVAKVPFRDLSSYERKVVHGYVGTMYGYSKDISVKNAPEDFVFYEPQNIQYTTTYINYSIDKNYHVTGEGKPFQGQFFAHFKDGSGAAYCTFMGGDTKITQVRTGTKNGRRLIILKDSFGNAIPGYLFYSFEEVHVIDGRYFTKNMKAYVQENKITDILFANNIFQACSAGRCEAYKRFLTQGPGVPKQLTAEKKEEKKDKKKKEKTEEAEKIDSI